MPVSRPRRRKDRAIRQLAWFHRWLGIATCVIFALWFASGAVLLFEPFPSLPRADQLRLERPIDLAGVTIAPRQALAAVAGANSLRLVQRGSAPAYIVGTGAGIVAIDARNGARLGDLSGGDVASIAAQATGPFGYDQWIVHNRFDPYRPFFRLDLGDADGTRVYLSAATGEIVQRTTAWGRGVNWVGAVLHWAYFTPLRASFTLWDQAVWWLSLVGLLVAVAGTILGVVRTLAARRQRTPSLTFYRLKWMRWHHLLGLFASVFVLAWILSGWLSMDHGRIFSRGRATEAQLARYTGGPLPAGLASVTAASLGRYGAAREIAFTMVGGRAILTAWYPDGAARRTLADGTPLDTGAVAALAAKGVASAWPGPPAAGASPVPATDTYALAEGWPDTALLLAGTPRVRPDIVVDGVDGRLLTVLDGSRKAYSWVYFALHTFNVPGLTGHPWLRRTLVMIPLLFGFLFSITGVVIGFQRLRKSL